MLNKKVEDSQIEVSPAQKPAAKRDGNVFSEPVKGLTDSETYRSASWKPENLSSSQDDEVRPFLV